jgi:hypothetical protein
MPSDRALSAARLYQAPARDQPGRRRSRRGGRPGLGHRTEGHDPVPARRPRAEQTQRATALIAALGSCPIPELARLGRTLHGGATNSSPRSPTPTSATAHRKPQPEDQEHEAGGPRLPQLHQLPAATVAQPRPHPEGSLTDADQSPPSQLGCVEPLYGDVVVLDHAGDVGVLDLPVTILERAGLMVVEPDLGPQRDRGG